MAFSEASRIQFTHCIENWPHGETQTPESLSEVGFFYDGKKIFLTNFWRDFEVIASDTYFFHTSGWAGLMRRYASIAEFD